MPKSENIKKLKYFRKFRLFLRFLVLSVLLWIFITLTGTFSYWTTVRLEIEQNLKDRFLQEQPAEKVVVRVKTSGFHLIYLYFFPKKITLQTSDFTADKNFQFYYLPNRHLPNIQKQWKDPKIEIFEKDSIFIALGKMQSKKIAVKSRVKLHLESGYGLIEPMALKPDSIWVSGPEKYLNPIQNIQTQTIEHNAIQSDFQWQIGLDLNQEVYRYLVFSDSIVQVKGKVSKFTEIKITLPVFINTQVNPQKVEIFPKTAVLYYQVSFENQKKISPSDFEISVQIPESNESKLTFLIPQLTQKPDFIKSYRIEPSAVNYLIYE